MVDVFAVDPKIFPRVRGEGAQDIIQQFLDDILSSLKDGKEVILYKPDNGIWYGDDKEESNKLSWDFIGTLAQWTTSIGILFPDKVIHSEE